MHYLYTFHDFLFFFVTIENTLNKENNKVSNIFLHITSVMKLIFFYKIFKEIDFSKTTFQIVPVELHLQGLATTGLLPKRIYPQGMAPTLDYTHWIAPTALHQSAFI